MAAPTENLKLTYFNAPGRAEVARLAFAIGNISFEDERLSREEFIRLKPELPYGQLPVLKIGDNTTVAQSHAIARYAGKLAGLYPENALQALQVDEFPGCVEDMVTSLSPTFGLTGDAQKEAREKLIAEDGKLRTLFACLEKRIPEGAENLVGDSLTLADLYVFSFVSGLKSGWLDHIPVDFVSEKSFPKLNQVFEAVKSDPRIQEYYSNKQQ